MSKTYLKDAVFEVNVRQQKLTKKKKNPTMSFLTPKSNTVSELDIVLSQLTHVYTEFNRFPSNIYLIIEKEKGRC